MTTGVRMLTAVVMAMVARPAPASLTVKSTRLGEPKNLLHTHTGAVVSRERRLNG